MIHSARPYRILSALFLCVLFPLGAEAKPLTALYSDPLVVYEAFFNGGQAFNTTTQNSNLFQPLFASVSEDLSPDYPTVVVRTCQLKSGFNTLSTEENCEGLPAGNPLNLGYIFKAPFPGTVPLLRYGFTPTPNPSASPSPNPSPSPGLPPSLWVTTDPVEPESEGYTDPKILGYVYSLAPTIVRAEDATRVAVYSKFGNANGEEGDHMLTLDPKEENESYQNDRVEFHVTTAPTSKDDGLIYRCQASNDGRKYASMSSRCGGTGVIRDSVLGYISRVARSGLIPLRRYMNKKLNDRWVTTRAPEELGIEGYTEESVVGYVAPETPAGETK